MRFLFGPMVLFTLSSWFVLALGVFLRFIDKSGRPVLFLGKSGGIHPSQSSDGIKDGFDIMFFVACTAMNG